MTPPHSPEPAKRFADFGGYPEDALLCTDATLAGGRGSSDATPLGQI